MKRPRGTKADQQRSTLSTHLGQVTGLTWAIHDLMDHLERDWPALSWKERAQAGDRLVATLLKATQRAHAMRVWLLTQHNDANEPDTERDGQ